MTTRIPAARRWLPTILAASLPALSPALWPASAAAQDALCDESAPLLYPAPDGAWRAIVQERACATPTGAGAAVLVVLQPAAGADGATRVLAIAVPRAREEWPRPRWRDASTLEIWVPNLARILEAPPADGAVRVELHYCRDNPADRDAVAAYREALAAWMRETTEWARRRKAEPGSEGPRPARPQEPRPPPGRCDPADFPAPVLGVAAR